MAANITSVLPDFLVALRFKLTCSRFFTALTYQGQLISSFPSDMLSVNDYINLCLAILTDDYSPFSLDPAGPKNFKKGVCHENRKGH